MMVRLLYASRAAKPMLPGDIEVILDQCRSSNPALGITGILCWSGSMFMQVLEGGREEVNGLYRHIVHDPRHQEVTLLHYEDITERQFSGWTMGQVNLSKVNPSLLLKYSPRAELDPFAMGAAASMALLLDLIASASIIGRV